jgi:sirohydrochlorin ferrochelatase
VAMAEPRLETVLEEVACLPVRRVVVQPHLLFGGVLLDRVAAIVSEYAERYPGIQWATAAHLGPSKLVAQAALGRACPLFAQSR